jgi:ubiquinone/menaquinone biosynthesis C-methylase UbiE
VIGIDMTPATLATARATAQLLGQTNIEFREGLLEALPGEDHAKGIGISNRVINLSPDKAEVLSEAYRVLTPGGHLQIADIVVGKVVLEDAKAAIALWAG